MLRVMLYQQWKTVRLPLFLLTILVFAVPGVIAWITTWSGSFGSAAEAALIIGPSMGTVYPILAGATGLLLATTAWSADHRGGHVYAWSLPLPRSYYAALRFFAGALLLMIPVLALSLGSLISSVSVAVPDGLTAYPVALGLRFGLAALVSFAMFFAISAGKPRTAGWVILALLALPVVQLVISVAGSDINLLRPVGTFLFDQPGPFEIFGGRWMLIDV